MASNWTAGADYTPDGSWNAYSQYGGQQGLPGITSPNPYSGGLMDTSIPKTTEDQGFAYNTGAGVSQYNTNANSATGGAVSGAANGYAQGGWWGAVVGGISGYYGGKENEEQANKNPQLDVAKFQAEERERIRQLQMQETRDAFNQYTDGITPNTFNYTNGLLGGGGTNGLFNVQAPTQPVVNPEQNSYGLLRG